MRVYIVLGIFEHESSTILSVYLNEQDAYAEKERLEHDMGTYFDWIEVEPHTAQ